MRPLVGWPRAALSPLPSSCTHLFADLPLLTLLSFSCTFSFPESCISSLVSPLQSCLQESQNSASCNTTPRPLLVSCVSPYRLCASCDPIAQVTSRSPNPWHPLWSVSSWRTGASQMNTPRDCKLHSEGSCFQTQRVSNILVIYAPVQNYQFGQYSTRMS